MRHITPAFVEDPVRLLRIARFAAKLGQWGFRVAHGTQGLMKKMAAGSDLLTLKPERIMQELWKALDEPQPWRFFEVLHRCGALQRLLPELAGKVRLNILVLLTPQFHGVGPHSYSKRFTWPYGGLLVGTDPVAVDATGARIIQEKRNRYFGEAKPIAPSPHHIEIADSRYGLGNSRSEKIELVRLGWQDDALIG